MFYSHLLMLKSTVYVQLHLVKLGMSRPDHTLGKITSVSYNLKRVTARFIGHPDERQNQTSSGASISLEM